VDASPLAAQDVSSLNKQAALALRGLSARAMYDEVAAKKPPAKPGAVGDPFLAPLKIAALHVLRSR